MSKPASCDSAVETPLAASGGESSFEDLLTDLAASFINVESEALDDHLQSALRRIVLFLGIDRATIGRFDDASRQWLRTHSWALPGIAPVPSPITEAQLPYLVGRLRSGLATLCSHLADLPPEAAQDQAMLRALDQKSLALFPADRRGPNLGRFVVRYHPCRASLVGRRGTTTAPDLRDLRQRAHAPPKGAGTQARPRG